MHWNPHPTFIWVVAIYNDSCVVSAKIKISCIECDSDVCLVAWIHSAVLWVFCEPFHLLGPYQSVVQHYWNVARPHVIITNICIYRNYRTFCSNEKFIIIPFSYEFRTIVKDYIIAVVISCRAYTSHYWVSWVIPS